MLIGRYPGDIYAGGNPWQLLTAVLAELFYQGASEFSLPNNVMSVEARKEWASLFKISENSTQKEFATASLKAGDAVLYRLFQHVKNDGGHIAEQISKTAGDQTSAEDLTWSYANILSAMHFRNTNLSPLAKGIEA